MRNAAEDRVRNFYSTVGWAEEQGITEDARRFEDLRENARDYVSKCRLRVLRHIPATGEKILDMASGSIQYPEYLEYSKGFAKRYCVDLSSQALESAEEKIGDHGVFWCGSFFDLELDSNTFDCAISLHTIYHIDRDLQEKAVRKLIQVCKPGAPIIIVYSNPDNLLTKLARMLRKLKASDDVSLDSGLYFFAHPLSWWNRFSDEADVRIYPWRSLSSLHQKRLIPDNRLGHAVFSVLYAAEEWFPRFFVRYFVYPMIVLTKR
jgi:SAM-dependent methyltransferase